MSAMVLSSVRRFIEMSPKLEKIGIRNIHFFNSKANDELTTPMETLVPFMDMLVLGSDAHCSPYLTRLVDAAMDRHIPVVSEDCIEGMEECLY